MENIELFEKAKKMFKNGHEVYMEIKRKNGEFYGVALFTNNNEVAVFEGNDDGCDDKIYNIKDFQEKYEVLEIKKEK